MQHQLSNVCKKSPYLSNYVSLNCGTYTLELYWYCCRLFLNDLDRQLYDKDLEDFSSHCSGGGGPDSGAENYWHAAKTKPGQHPRHGAYCCHVIID